MFNFGRKTVETQQIDLGQVEVEIELYSGEKITKTIKGIYCESFESYSPCKHQLKYFMDKVKKENVLEISKGKFINISKEIKTVSYGEIKPLVIEVLKEN